MDDDGFMFLPTEKFGLGKSIYHLPAMLRGMKDHGENVRKAKHSLELADARIAALAEKDCSHMDMEECLRGLTKLYDLITDTAYVRFRYAVFPAFMMNPWAGTAFEKGWIRICPPTICCQGFLTKLQI